jgi:hypothetical protein
MIGIEPRATLCLEIDQPKKRVIIPTRGALSWANEAVPGQGRAQSMSPYDVDIARFIRFPGARLAADHRAWRPAEGRARSE